MQISFLSFKLPKFYLFTFVTAAFAIICLALHSSQCNWQATWKKDMKRPLLSILLSLYSFSSFQLFFCLFLFSVFFQKSFQLPFHLHCFYLYFCFYFPVSSINSFIDFLLLGFISFPHLHSFPLFFFSLPAFILFFSFNSFVQFSGIFIFSLFFLFFLLYFALLSQCPTKCLSPF